MGEIDLFKRARDKREKEHKEFVMSIENIDVHLDSAKLRADLALADSKIEAIKEMCDEHMKYSLHKQDDPFHKGIYCSYMNISNLIDKLGADK